MSVRKPEGLGAARLERFMDLCRLSVLSAALVAASAHVATAAAPRSMGELDYKVSVQFRWHSQPVAGRFRVVPQPVLVSHNTVQRPRFCSWKLEPLEGSTDPEFREVLPRVERMLYLSGPAQGMKALDAYAGIHGRKSPLWQVEVPHGLQVYAYLAEVQPGLLALSYLTGRFDQGDLMKIELQLETSRLSPSARPAENGMALLGALQRLAGESSGSAGFLDTKVQWVLPE